MREDRRSAREPIVAEVMLRRTGQVGFRVRLNDISPQGCRFEFVDRPALNERVWVKLEGMDSLVAIVCWVDGPWAGVRFERPIHPAVLKHYLGKYLSH